MMRTAALMAVVPGAVAINRNFLGNDMRPDAVAHTLGVVEDSWMQDATKFAHIEARGGDGSSIHQAFTKSCSQVVKGIVQGSSGDKIRTAEYMADVCGQKSLAGWHKATCLSLRTDLFEKMTDSNFDNRESFNAAKVCDSSWDALVKQMKVEVEKEKLEVEKEKAAHKEELKKEAEQAAKDAKEAKEAEEAAEKKDEEVQIKKAKEAEVAADAEMDGLKHEDEKRKADEAVVRAKEENNFEKTKEEIEAVEAAADEKIKEADAVENEDVKPEAKSVAKTAAPKQTKPTTAKVVVAAKPAATIKLAVAAKPVTPVKLAVAVKAPAPLKLAMASKPAAPVNPSVAAKPVVVAKVTKPVVASKSAASLDAKVVKRAVK